MKFHANALPANPQYPVQNAVHPYFPVHSGTWQASSSSKTRLYLKFFVHVFSVLGFNMNGNLILCYVDLEG